MPRLAHAFDGSLESHNIISNLSQIMGLPLDIKGMLYVFDEVQVSNRAITALKYFQESGFPHPVIAAGSLLGVAVNQKDYSLPVGKVNTMVLHPMTFDEFMVATGNTLMLEGIREAYSEKRAYQLHDQAMDLYRTYLLVGGMPEAGRGRPAGADQPTTGPQIPAQTGRGKPPGADWLATRPQETALPVGQKPPAHVLQLPAESIHLSCW